MEKTILEVVQEYSKASPVEYGVVLRPKLVLKDLTRESAKSTPVRQERTGSRSLAAGILAHLQEARKPAQAPTA